MGRTSLPATDEVREAVEDVSLPGHDTIPETILDLTRIVPDADDFNGGCQGPGCERTPHGDEGYADSQYIFIPFVREWEAGGNSGTARGVMFFCSPSCYDAHREQVNTQLPSEPDMVKIGGRAEWDVEFHNASYTIDGDTHEIGIPIPGALSGSDSRGNEYEYEGEPVFIMDDDAGVVQEYVVDEVIHEEGHTAVLLGNDHTITALNHPDRDVRAEYRNSESREEWPQKVCTECDSLVPVNPEDPREECPCCGSTDWIPEEEG